MRRFWKSGDPFVWLTGGALAFSLLMILGFITLILVKGLGQFWPADLVLLHLKDGRQVLGEVWDRELIPQFESGTSGSERYRLRVKTGNRDLYPLDFRWIEESDIGSRSHPEDALALERTEWGNFYGFFKSLKVDGRTEETDLGKAWSGIESFMEEMQKLHKEIEEIEEDRIGDINYHLENLRLGIRKLSINADTTRTEVRRRITEINDRIQHSRSRYNTEEKALAVLYESSRRYTIGLITADGREKDVSIFNIVRIYRPNDMSVIGKVGFYLSKAWEFISSEPRESNTEGGIFPAIFGTVLLVMIMSVAVVPLGVMAAIYLNEYAKQGPWVQAIRIAVNNLAGVPSIVYGVFGLGFFIYAIGGTLDQLFFREALPTPTFGTGGILWASLTLALLTVPVVIVATEEGLAAVPREVREGSIALAATKFETLRRIVIPGALPGILTGLILAVARAAGEVAPLMITGVVKLAPSLPVDGYAPYIHLERKFMHLGFHIYDVGFQSPNVEAAIPMVYSTTLLLLLIVLLLNVVAIAVRNHLRKKLSYSAF